MRSVLVALLLIAGCQSSPTFTITNQRASSAPFVGFGAQLNPYLYCAPNWGDVNEQNVADLEEKIIRLAPQHVRVFMHLDWWTDKGDAWIARGDPRMVESFIRTVGLAQRAGASVNITLWYGPWTDPPAQMRRFVEILAQLIHKHQLASIQYVTIQNEPNGESSKGPYKIPLETYNQLYRALDSELRTANLRDRIKIVGGDLVQNRQQIWFKNLAENLAEVCDGYSMHAYWDYWDTEKLLRRVSEVPKIVDSFPTAQRRPIYAMEFGVRGIRRPREEPGRFGDGRLITETTVAAQETAWFYLEALNRGYVAIVQWDGFDAHYNIPMRYGLIGDVTTGWKLRPNYFVLKLLTHSAKPGWNAVRVEGADKNRSVAAMRGPNNELTVFAQNRRGESEVVTIGGVPSGRMFRVTLWNARGDGGLSNATAISSDARGVLRIKLPPMTVASLTAN